MASPNAPALTYPIGAVVIDRALTTRFLWTFSDVDPGDTQSEYDLRYRIVGAGAWTDTNATTASTYRDITGGTLAAGDYEWQVRTYDALGAVGPYSASEFFTAANLPTAPTITSPADGADVIAESSVTWTAASQTNYQVRIVADSSLAPYPSVVYFDTGDVVDIATRTVAVTHPVNNRWEHVQVRVKAAGLWSAWASHRVHAEYPSLKPGTLTVTADAGTASLLVETVAATPGMGEPTAASIDIYIRELTETGFGTRYAAGLPPSGIWRWWTPRSGVDYDIRTLTHGSDGSTAWSARVIYHIIDGGYDGAPARDTILDGGTPGAVVARIIDGGS